MMSLSLVQMKVTFRSRELVSLAGPSQRPHDWSSGPSGLGRHWSRLGTRCGWYLARTMVRSVYEDAETGVPTASPITGHGGSVSSVAVSRAGGRDVVVSGSHDGTVRIWGRPGEWGSQGPHRLREFGCDWSGHWPGIVSCLLGLMTNGARENLGRRSRHSGRRALLGHKAPVNSVAIGRIAGRGCV